MDLINFLTGLALGIISLSMKRFMWLIRVILSLGTSFMFLKLLHPLIDLRPITEWTWPNLFNGYNFWFQSIIFLGISLLIFYWIVPLLLRKVLLKKLSAYLDNYLKKLSNVEAVKLKRIVSESAVKITRFLQRIDPKPINKRVDVNYGFVYYDTIDGLISSFALSIQLIICWMFFIPSFTMYLLILFAVLLLIFAFNMIAIPFIKNFIDLINKITNDELNTNIEQLPK